MQHLIESKNMKAYWTVDKAAWGDGEWEGEPDKAHWIDEKTGLDCLIVRGHSGALCGYVGVPKGHEYYAKDYRDVPVEAHGGLTFSDYCADSADESKAICHAKERAANADVWWLGFDCAHSGDVVPAHKQWLFYSYSETYKNFSYVVTETEYLATQLNDDDPEGVASQNSKARTK